MRKPTRRTFLSTMGGAAGLAAVSPSLLGAAGQNPQGWDFAWLDKLTGKHRQVFDTADFTISLVVVRNWYDAYETVFRLKPAELSAVVGIAGKAFPINASDELYRRFPIGEKWEVKDPVTGKWAERNIFMDGGTTAMARESKVRPLQAKGAVFWQCNNALSNVASRLAAAVQRPQPEVYAELRAGLNPGVILVPAHTMLIGLCQERGCAYELL